MIHPTVEEFHVLVQHVFSHALSLLSLRFENTDDYLETSLAIYWSCFLLQSTSSVGVVAGTDHRHDYQIKCSCCAEAFFETVGCYSSIDSKNRGAFIFYSVAKGFVF